MRVNLSAPEILQLANSFISKSKAAHDAVGSVPLDKVMRVQCYFLCELFSRCGNIKLLLLLDSLICSVPKIMKESLQILLNRSKPRGSHD